MNSRFMCCLPFGKTSMGVTIVAELSKKNFCNRKCLESAKRCYTYSSDTASPKPGQIEKKLKLVAVSEAHRFIKDCLFVYKVTDEHARAMADLLVGADCHGHTIHGISRLPIFVEALDNHLIDPLAVPKILKESPGSAWVDGNNGMGAVVGNFCIDLAVKKALHSGIAMVCAKNCTYYGMAGWYSFRAMRHGLIGITMCNTSPRVAPTRSKESMLGTNPISCGAPAKEDKFILDMATSVAALGRVQTFERENTPVPFGWVQDMCGKETCDAALALKSGSLRPLGSTAKMASYKGYGLAAVVDILTGVLADANYSYKVPKNIMDEMPLPPCKPAVAPNLGQNFIAIDPNAFAPNFEDRMHDFNMHLRRSNPIDPALPVILPGDREDVCMKVVNDAGGIAYTEEQMKICEELAKRLNVTPINCD